MAVKTLDDLFHETLKDLYYAEKKLVKTLPKMAKQATSPTLKEAIEHHLIETEIHVTRKKFSERWARSRLPRGVRLWKAW